MADARVAGQRSRRIYVAPPSPVLRLALLDGFELAYASSPVPLPLSAQRVAAFVALRERPLLRAYVATTLWPDSTEERSSANLRSALWRLRRDGGSPVHATSTHLRLAPEVIVDLHQVAHRSRDLLDSTSGCPEWDFDELPLFGDLLPGWYDDWVVIERERFRQLRLHALEALATRLIATGRHGRAIEAALLAVQEEPLRESAHRALARVHFAEGNSSEAITCYRRYRKVLREELGVEPSEQFKSLVRDGITADLTGTERGHVNGMAGSSRARVLLEYLEGPLADVGCVSGGDLGLD